MASLAIKRDISELPPSHENLMLEVVLEACHLIAEKQESPGYQVTRQEILDIYWKVRDRLEGQSLMQGM